MFYVGNKRIFGMAQLLGFLSFKGIKNAGLAALAAATLTACTTSQDPATRNDGFNDPYETQNRAIHEFNKGFDRSLFRPVSQGYAVIPVEIRDTVNNFSDNLGEPGNLINALLQGDLRGAGRATVRFAMNTTIGIGGLVDAASEFGIADAETDFGETMHVWGAGEGAFIELPFLGASTQRDTVGFFVDFFTNPLTLFTIDGSPERYVPPTAYVGSALNNRDKFKGTIDTVLYESADSYAQSRSIYLQNRRFELEGSDPVDEDPYIDDYLDPYAE